MQSPGEDHTGLGLLDTMYGRVVAKLLPGDSFGQLSAETGVRRTASVVASCVSELVEVS